MAGNDEYKSVRATLTATRGSETKQKLESRARVRLKAFTPVVLWFPGRAPVSKELGKGNMAVRMRFVTAALIVSLVLLNCVVITKWLYVTECGLKSADASVVIVRNQHRVTESVHASSMASLMSPSRMNLSFAYDLLTTPRNVTDTFGHVTLMNFLHEFTSSLPDDFDFNT